MHTAAASSLASDDFTAFQATTATPAVAWGLIKDSELVAAGGHGEIAGRTPDETSVFRIASMTKSFTAAACLLLRDRGVLRLDDRIRDWVPQAAKLQHDGPEITLRDLLVMRAGLPTDDPWGDRQESLDRDGLLDLLDDRLAFAWPVRDRFEYSNTGYALLGAAIEAAAGRAWSQVVQDELTAPLGMTSTTVDWRHVPAARLAVGHQLTPQGPAPVEPVTPGAYSPMGGLHSTVADLAAWVSGMQAAWTSGNWHPLSTWSRREMQTAQQVVSTEILSETWQPTGPMTASYGMGLWVTESPAFGRTCSHSGGYPGYGSHMRWHPASGWGIVALANSTYAPVADVAARVLYQVIDGHAAAPAATPWPETLAAMDAVESLLTGWDARTADRWFAGNMDLDTPRPAREREFQQTASRLGPFTRVEVSHRSPAHATWVLQGADGSARLDLLMSPQKPSLVQRISITRLP